MAKTSSNLIQLSIHPGHLAMQCVVRTWNCTMIQSCRKNVSSGNECLAQLATDAVLEHTKKRSGKRTVSKSWIETCVAEICEPDPKLQGHIPSGAWELPEQLQGLFLVVPLNTCSGCAIAGSSSSRDMAVCQANVSPARAGISKKIKPLAVSQSVWISDYT